MSIPQTLWLICIFLLSFGAYLSFSVVYHNVVALLARPLGPKEEEFDLPPLTRLCPELEQLSVILSFSRLIFVIPVLIIAYRLSTGQNPALILLILLALTVLLYILPEVVSKQFSLSVFRRLVQVISFLLYPLFWLMTRFTPHTTGETVREEEEKKAKGNGELLEETSEELKGDILKAVSTIEDTTVREVMTPRVDMISISSAGNLGELHQLFKEHKFSRLPVYKGKVDNVIGIASVMDFVSSIPETDLNSPVTNIMRPATFVPETKKVLTLLREFRDTHAQVAIVIDEYGGTSGLVTLEDLLEELVGEIGDEYDEIPPEVHKDKDGDSIVPGKFPIEKMEEIFQIEVPEEDFETISGLIFSVLGRIPAAGERVKYKNLELEIVEADKRRIHRVKIHEFPKEDAKNAL
jgi:putative hemolysin